jgi:integrase
MSSSNNLPSKPSAEAIGPTTQELLSDEARAYLAESVSENTIRAVRADLRVFTQWGGTLPTQPEEVANFIAEQARAKKPATLQRYLSSLHTWHVAHGHASPVRTETVRRVMTGIGRQLDSTPESAPPLLLEDFKRVMDALTGDSLATTRNRALLALAYFGAFRRSEVVALRIEDLRIWREGMIVGLRASKANQGGAPESKAIARGPQGSPYCPVQRVAEWLAEQQKRGEPAEEGPLFPPVNPDGTLGNRPITPENFYQFLKGALRQAGLDPTGYSPHSLRSGFITASYLAGKDPFKIRRISGHRSQEVFERYLHEADRFSDNASDLL